MAKISCGERKGKQKLTGVTGDSRPVLCEKVGRPLSSLSRFSALLQKKCRHGKPHTFAVTAVQASVNGDHSPSPIAYGSIRLNCFATSYRAQDEPSASGLALVQPRTVL